MGVGTAHSGENVLPEIGKAAERKIRFGKLDGKRADCLKHFPPDAFLSGDGAQRKKRRKDEPAFVWSSLSCG